MVNCTDIHLYEMKHEKAACRLYLDMAARVDDPELKELFLGLSQEEAKLKLYFKTQYDDRALAQN